MSAVDDLHKVLKAARIRTPVVLVGHSLGGLHAILYADRYQAEVAGLVLIDPSFAGQDKELTTEEHLDDARSNRAIIAGLEACAALARQGKLATEPHTECFEYAPGRTAAEKLMLSFAVTHPGLYETQISEIKSMYSTDGISDTNSTQERAAKRSFGNIPMVVLTAPVTQEPGATPAQQARATEFWKSWKAGHDALAARSTRGESILVDSTSHFIQIDQPLSVVSALQEVVDQVRTRKSD
jgi:pimeloyl-ACP methyl ester carboxylesterase